jgi:hypothetical protein
MPPVLIALRLCMRFRSADSLTFGECAALLMKTPWQPENRRHENARDDHRPQRRAIQAPRGRGRFSQLSGG